MPQPAAPRGRPGLPPVFLLASASKKKLFAEYEKSAEAGVISFKTFRQQWQIHAPELVIMKPCSDVCYICDKHHEALLRRGGVHPPFAEGRYSCGGSCWSREATTSPANGHLCWPLALLEQGDKALSSFSFANSMGEWRIRCFIFGHNPLAIYFSLWQNPFVFLYIPTLLFCLVCVPYHAWYGFKFCPGVFHIDVNSLQQKTNFSKYPYSMVLAVCGSYIQYVFRSLSKRS